jgi:hypothetical protein
MKVQENLSAKHIQFLIDRAGGVGKLAKALKVSPLQLSRWGSGQERPDGDVTAKLLELDYVLALALQAWHPTMVTEWMTSSNGFLEGAQPMTVLMQGGSAEVVGALNATLSGAYA